MAKKVKRTRSNPPISFEIVKANNGFLCINTLKNYHTTKSVHESTDSLIEALKKALPKLIAKANSGHYYD